MTDNDVFFDATGDEENPPMMFRCNTCGHEVPVANMSVHAAICVRRSNSHVATNRVEHNSEDEEDPPSTPAVTKEDVESNNGVMEGEVPNLSTTIDSSSTEGCNNMGENEEVVTTTFNTDADEEPDVEVGGSAGGEAVRHMCCICMDEIEPNDELIGCTGSAERHYWHTECGLEYIRSAVGAGGVFEGERTQQILAENQQESLTSAAGELPCPSFVEGCDCGAIPNDTIFRMLGNSLDVSEQFMRAYRNVNIREAIADQPTAINDHSVTGDARTALPVVDQIYHRVTEELSRGYEMSCPNCTQQGLKDTQCMHIHCPMCGSDWCYCCGRFRLESGPVGERCRGCDSTDIYIERQPGWGSFALPGEDAKTGALWEFHKRVQTYYVRRIKEETPAGQWESFMQAYPNILENTPTFGRHIEWDDLDSASPPVFGNSTENDLLWKLPPILQQQQPPALPQEHEDIGSFKEIFETTKGKLWIVALFITVLFLILKWTVGSPGLSVFADSAVAVTSFVGISYTLLWSTDFFAANRNHVIPQTLQEAFFIGKAHQQPFLSSAGRLGSSRHAHIYFWIGSIALGSLLVGIPNEFESSPVMRIIGTAILTFGLVCCTLEMAVGNMSQPPDLNNGVECETYWWFSLVSAVFVLCLALGAGLMTGESYGKIRTSGIFLLSAGIGALASEYVPRLFRKLFGRRDAIWMPLDARTREVSYIFFLSASTGSSLCWLGSSGNGGALISGILILVVGFPSSWYHCTRSN